MAEASNSAGQDRFSCPICLDQLLDPVTIPCGHSYCMRCITNCWNQDHRAPSSCPLCKRTFTPRPSLYKNVMLAEMVENLKQKKVEAVHSALIYAGPGDVECDSCTGRRYKAVKSCLMCLESYCQTHFELHEKCHSGRRHKTIDATGRLQQMVCSKHDKQLEIFCRTDQQCICYLCPMDEHRNHDTVAAVVERKEKQRTLEEMRIKFQQSILEREKQRQGLKDTDRTNKRSAQTALENIEKTFTELIRSIERSRSEVTQMIRSQENANVHDTEVLKQLEQEIEDLRKRDAELEQLLQMDDHIQFLQSFRSVSRDSPRRCFILQRPLCFDDLEKSVSELKERVEDLCKQEVDEMMRGMSDMLFSSRPTRCSTDTLERCLEASQELRDDPLKMFFNQPLFSESPPTRQSFFSFRSDLPLILPDIPLILPNLEKDTETP